MARELQDMTDQELLSIKSGDYSKVDLRSLSNNALRVLKNRRGRSAQQRPINSQVPEYLKQQKPESFGKLLPEISREQAKTIPFEFPDDPTRVRFADPFAEDEKVMAAAAKAGGVKREPAPTTTTAPRAVEGFKQAFGLRSDVPSIVKSDKPGVVEFPYESGAYRGGQIAGMGAQFVPFYKGAQALAGLAKIANPIVRLAVRSAATGVAGAASEVQRDVVAGADMETKDLLEAAGWAGGTEAALGGLGLAIRQGRKAMVAAQIRRATKASEAEAKRMADEAIAKWKEFQSQQPKQIGYLGDPASGRMQPMTPKQSKISSSIDALQSGDKTTKAVAARKFLEKTPKDEINEVMRMRGVYNTPSTPDIVPPSRRIEMQQPPITMPPNLQSAAQVAPPGFGVADDLTKQTIGPVQAIPPITPSTSPLPSADFLPTQGEAGIGGAYGWRKDVPALTQTETVLGKLKKIETERNPSPPTVDAGKQSLIVDTKGKPFTLHAAGGPLLGFETDDNGNVTYNPEKGLAGLVGAGLFGSAVSTKSGKQVLQSVVKGATTAAKEFGSLGKMAADMTKGSSLGWLAQPVHRLSKYATTPFTQDLSSKLAGAETNIRAGIGSTFKWFEDETRKFLGPVGTFTNWGNRHWIREYGKDYMEGKSGVTPPNEKVKQYLDGMKDQFKTMAGVVKSANPNFNVRNMYFPHWLTDDGRKALEVGSGPVFDAIKKMAGDVGVDVEFFMRKDFDKFMAKRYGSVDFERLAKLPDHVMVNGKKVQVLEKDPFKVFPSYVDAAYRRAEVMRLFGADPRKAQEQAQLIATELFKKEGPDAAKAFEDMWRGLNGYPVSDPAIQHLPIYRAWRATSNVLRGSLLSASSPLNVLQIPFHAARAGSVNTIRGVVDAFRPTVRDELRSSGAFLNNTMGDIYYAQDLTGASGKVASGMLRATGHNALNKFNNIVMARASEQNLIDAISRIRSGDEGVLRKLWGMDAKGLRRQLEYQHQFSQVDIDRMVKDGIAPSDINRVRQQGPMLSNLSHESALAKQRWLSKPLIKEIFALTQFTRGVANAGSYAVREAGNGNIRPLLTFAGASELSYDAGNALHNLLFDRANEDNMLWEKVYGRLMKTGVLGLLSVPLDKIRAVAEFGEEPLSLNMPMAEAMIQATRTAQTKGIDKALLQAVPAYRLLWSVQGRATSDVQYYADRLESKVYLGQGISQQGRPYKMFDPIVREGDQTVAKMLADAQSRGIGTQVKIELLKRHYRKMLESKSEKVQAFIDYINELDKMDDTEQSGD